MISLLIYLMLFPDSIIPNRILLPQKEENNLGKCLLEISEIYFPVHGTILAFSQNYNFNGENTLKWSTYIQNSAEENEMLLSNFEKIDNYLVDVKDSESLIETLPLLKTYGWNSKGKFVISLESQDVNLEDIFRELWRHKIINAAVILPDNNTGDANIFIWFPYLGDNCGDDYSYKSLVGACKNGSLISYQHLFPSKIPKDLHGCKFFVRANYYPPYVMFPPSEALENRSTVFMNLTDGIDVVIMNILADRMNFSVIYSVANHSDAWGVLSPNGTGTWMMKALLEEEVDMGISCLEPAMNRVKYLEISRAYVVDILTWIVPAAQLEKRWKCLLHVFKLETWLTILVVFILAGVTVYIIGISTEYEYVIYKRQASCWSNTFSSLLGIAVKTLPRTTFLRSFYILWIIFGVHLSATFNTFLISVLTKPKYEKQISTLKDILDSKMNIGLDPMTTRYINEADGWVAQKILSSWINCRREEVCLERVAFKRDLAFINSRLFLFYFLFQERYRDPISKRPLMHLFNRAIVHFPVHIFATKDFPLMPRINEILKRLAESGLSYKKILDILINFTHSSHFEENSTQSLTLIHLQGALWILGIGKLTSFLVFVSEKIVYKIINRKKSKNI